MNEMEELIELQKKLQQKMKVKFDLQYKKDMILACHTELSEALQNLHWKPWRKYSKEVDEDRESYLYELIDVQHFLLNLFIAEGLDATDIKRFFKDKNNINVRRQEDGY